MESGDLQPGDKLLQRDGKTAYIRSISRHPEATTVYNFSVADDHNYCVGASSLLVHNCPPVDEDAVEGIVWRALAKGEDPSLGLTARAPGNVDVSPLSHVAGKRGSPWISTSKLPSVAFEKYNREGYGVVAIDLSRIATVSKISGSSQLRV